LPEKFPNGDMKAEALWRLAWRAWRAEKYDEAVGWLEKQIAAVPHEENYWAEGQTHYWIGRAKEKLGKPAEAKDAYLRAVREYPPARAPPRLLPRDRRRDRAAAGAAAGAARFRAARGLRRPLFPARRRAPAPRARRRGGARAVARRPARPRRPAEGHGPRAPGGPVGDRVPLRPRPPVGPLALDRPLARPRLQARLADRRHP